MPNKPADDAQKVVDGDDLIARLSNEQRRIYHFLNDTLPKDKPANRYDLECIAMCWAGELCASPQPEEGKPVQGDAFQQACLAYFVIAGSVNESAMRNSIEEYERIATIPARPSTELEAALARVKELERHIEILNKDHFAVRDTLTEACELYKSRIAELEAKPTVPAGALSEALAWARVNVDADGPIYSKPHWRTVVTVLTAAMANKAQPSTTGEK